VPEPNELPNLANAIFSLEVCSIGQSRTMEDWRPLGKHRMRVEEDVLFVVAQGEIEGDEIIGLCEQLLQIQQKHGWVFEIVDATAGTGMSAKTRRQNAEWHRQHSLDVEAAVFGAGVFLQTIFSLLANALRIIGRGRLRTQFVANEAEARAWVALRREARRATT
jgi:hypothetical protein